MSLEYLKIENCECFKLADLNEFTKLRILEIKRLPIDSIDFNQHLKLPHLRALSIESCNRNTSGTKLVIDAPNLYSLRFPYSDPKDNKIFIKNPVN